MKKGKNILIILCFVSILIMSVGYSTFATEIKIDGNAGITGVWDVKVSNVEIESKSDTASSNTPIFTDNTITFDAKLNKPGDYVKYKITVKNAGTIDAILSNVLCISDDENGSSQILYETTNLKSELLSGNTTTFNITITYDKNTTSIPDIKTKKYTGIIEYEQM